MQRSQGHEPRPKRRPAQGGERAAVWKKVMRVLLTIFFILVIAGCIVASVLTVYILQFLDDESDIDLNNLRLSTTTILYAMNNETGEYEEYYRIHGEQNRIWVDYTQFPDYLKDVTIAAEDRRFLEHNGVDWKRTFGAFVNLIVPIYDSQQGGSTITQQVIKNVTGNDEVTIERKVTEILTALNLEKQYSKDQILEAYLNTVYFGGNYYGIQAAANGYFGKDVSELSIAECASIVASTQNPNIINPRVNPDRNKERRDYILRTMYEMGTLTEEQLEEELATPVVTIDAAQAAEEEEAAAGQSSVAGQSDTAEEQSSSSEVQDYFVDQVMEEVIQDLMEEEGYTYQRAEDLLINSGGYRIYLTVDPEMQDYVQNRYENFIDFPAVINEEYPQSACVILDTQGAVKAVAGGIGPKEGARVWSRVTDTVRQPGSTMKPIGPYAVAFENDIITYSTVIEDGPVRELNGNPWPVNYYYNPPYMGDITVNTAIQRSCNTVAVKVCDMVTPQNIFNFLENNLHITSLVSPEDDPVNNDVNQSSMAIGGMTHGISPLEMGAAYQIFANGGNYYEPHTYTRVLDSNGNVVLEKNTAPERAISFETATIINRLLYQVTHGPYGTGTTANLGTMPTIGKTGTSSDDFDQWFIGATPYYVGVVWMGYDENQQIRYYSYPPPILWRSIMQEVHQGLEYRDFEYSPNVVERLYCAETGQLAVEACPSTIVGYYKASNLPDECELHLGLLEEEEEDSDEENSDDRTDDESSRDDSEEESSSRPGPDDDGYQSPFPWLND